MGKKGFEEEMLSAPDAQVKKQREEDLAKHQKKIGVLGQEETALETRIASLKDEIEQAHASHLEELKRLRAALILKKDECSRLVDQNKADSKALEEQRIQVTERLGELADELKAVSHQKGRDLAWAASEKQKLNEEGTRLKAEDDRLRNLEQSFDQRNFETANLQKRIENRAQVLEGKIEEYEKLMVEDASAQQRLKSDQEFANEAVQKANMIREEAWKMKEEAKPLLAQAKQLMAEAEALGKKNTETAAALKQQKAKQNEKDKDLEDWEEALKVERAKIDKKKEILKKKGRG